MSARYLGDFTPGKTIRGRFNTVRPSTSVPFTLAGTPTLAVYKDDNTTESTAGVTLTVDFDARTGLHFYAVNTSADGTFYSSGSDFTVVLTAGTVDSVSAVGLVVGAFSLANRSALRPTTADRTLDVSAGGEAGLDWANVGSPTSSVNLSGTTVATVTTTTTATNLTNLPSIPANWLTAAGIAAGALDGKGNWNVGKTGYSLTPTTGLGNQTSNITGTITTVTTATNLTNLPSIPANWLTAAGIAAGALNGKGDWSTYAGGDTSGTTTLLTRLSTTRAGYLDNLSAGAVAQQATLTTVASYLDTEIAAILAVMTKLDTAMELDGAVYRFTTNALEQAPSGSGGDPWASTMETGVTYAGAMRAIYGVAAGDSSGFTDTSSTAAYKSSDGTKTRVTATVDTYGNRTVTARDLT